MDQDTIEYQVLIFSSSILQVLYLIVLTEHIHDVAMEDLVAVIMARDLVMEGLVVALMAWDSVVLEVMEQLITAHR